MKIDYNSQENERMDVQRVLNGAGDFLIVVRRNDLILFAETYADKIQSGQEKSTKSTHEYEAEKPMTQPQAIKFLGKSRQTLIQWRKKGIIQAYRLNGRIYYKPSELTAALQKLG